MRQAGRAVMEEKLMYRLLRDLRVSSQTGTRHPQNGSSAADEADMDVNQIPASHYSRNRER
jgi:hypothetical protein